MKKYSIKIDTEALEDIQEIIAWNESQKPGLGERFQNILLEQISHLAENPQIFVLRYKKIRCMLIRKFPYMVHFSLIPKLSQLRF